MVWVSEQVFFIVFGLVVATHSGTTRSVELNNDKCSPPPPRLLLFTPPCGQPRAVFGVLILICEAEDSPQHKYAARNHFLMQLCCPCFCQCVLTQPKTRRILSNNDNNDADDDEDDNNGYFFSPDPCKL